MDLFRSPKQRRKDDLEVQVYNSLPQAADSQDILPQAVQLEDNVSCIQPQAMQQIQYALSNRYWIICHCCSRIHAQYHC